MTLLTCSISDDSVNQFYGIFSYSHNEHIVFLLQDGFFNSYHTSFSDNWWWIHPAIIILVGLEGEGFSLGGKAMWMWRWWELGVGGEGTACEDARHVSRGQWQHRHRQQLLQFLLQSGARACYPNEWRWQVGFTNRVHIYDTEYRPLLEFQWW